MNSLSSEVHNESLSKSIELFKELEKKNIKHCHFKSNEHLYEGLNGITDLDILVDRKKTFEVQKELLELGYKRFESQPWLEYPGIEDWLGFDEITGKKIHIHLHYHLITGKRFVKEQHLPIESLVLDTAIKHPIFNIYVTNPNVEIILLIIRIAFKLNFRSIGKTNIISSDISAELAYLYDLIDIEKVSTYSLDIFGDSHGKFISNVIKNKSYYKISEVRKIRKIIRKSFKVDKRYNKLITEIKCLCGYVKLANSRLHRKFNLRTQHGKKAVGSGLLIAFIGCDGSGKSTVTTEITKWLSWKIDTQKIYLGSGDGNTNFIINSIKKTWSIIKKFRKSEDKINKKVKEKENRTKEDESIFRLVSNVIFGISMARYRYKKLINAKKDSLNGSLIITDRYPQNKIDGYNDGPFIKPNKDSFINKKAKKLEKRYFDLFCNLPPDVVIKLHITPEVGIKRKPDHNMEFLIKKSNAVKQIHFKNSYEINIDATQPLEIVLLDIKKEIWYLL